MDDDDVLPSERIEFTAAEAAHYEGSSSLRRSSTLEATWCRMP